MKKTIVLVFLCFAIIMAKYVVSGAYFDYKLRARYLRLLQEEYVDENKRIIADLELYRSANYLFTYKEQLQMGELTPERTVLFLDAIDVTKEKNASGTEER